MIGTPLHWIDGPWKGKLALAARPRGGEWLDDELASWGRQGIDIVFSLLESEENDALDLAGEASAAQANGMSFWPFPIGDRQVPASESALSDMLRKLDAELEDGRNVAIHCRQGVGRTGLVAACLLIMKGMKPDKAVQQLGAARGVPVPETPEQRTWLDQFATTFGGKI